MNIGPSQRTLLRAVAAEQGLYPREYAAKTGMQADHVSGAAVRLKKAGLLSTTGQRNATRYYLGESFDPVYLEGSAEPPATAGDGSEQATPIDPLLEAVGALEVALKNVRRAVKDHDRLVRMDTIVNISESLREGVK